MSCYVCPRNSNRSASAPPRSVGPTRVWKSESYYGRRKITHQDLDEVKVTLGCYRYAGQYQQRPSPAQGGIFQRVWWRYWRPAHMELPPVPVRMPDGEVCSIPAVPLPDRFAEMLQSWDLAVRG